MHINTYTYKVKVIKEKIYLENICLYHLYIERETERYVYICIYCIYVMYVYIYICMYMCFIYINIKWILTNF